MAYLALMLTVLLCGLLVYIAGRAPFRVGEGGGPLILAVTIPKRGSTPAAFAVLAMAVFGLLATFALQTIRPDDAAWVLLASLVIYMLYMLGIAVSLAHRPCPLEIHEQGIAVAADGRTTFARWNEIQYCRWMDRPGTLLVRCHDRKLLCSIPAPSIAQVTATLTGRVELRDAAGNVFAPAPPVATNPNPQPEDPWRRPRFQFHLNTLLLSAAALAAASGWIATLIERLDQIPPTP